MTKKEPASVLGPLDVVIACVGAQTLSGMDVMTAARYTRCLHSTKEPKEEQAVVHS